jgi:hypothetical protein
MSNCVFSYGWERTQLEILENMMKDKRVLMIVGGLVLVVVLVAGAFTAVRLLAKPAQSDYGPNVQVFEDVIDDGSGAVSITTIVEPSPDLPNQEMTTGGVFLRREDNSVFVGTGNVSVSVVVENGETSSAADHSGPEIEVVLTRDTVFYRDETDMNLEGAESGERRVQQILEQVDDLPELVKGDSMGVWGEQRGDRVIAAVIVFGEGQ